MSDFSNLSRLEVDALKTVPFVMPYDLGTLSLAPATKANRAYFNAQMKLMSTNRTRLRAIQEGRFTAKLDAEILSDERTLYAKYIVRSWDGVLDAEGKAAPFDYENCKKFLEALPDFLFEEIRDFARSPGNFIESGAEVDVEDLAKNSPSV